MTDSFDSRNDSETLVLLKERMREARERDRLLGEKIDRILDNQHDMDKKTGLTAERLESLQKEHAETKSRLDAVETDKRGAWAHVASVLSQIALWTAK